MSLPELNQVFPDKWSFVNACLKATAGQDWSFQIDPSTFSDVLVKIPCSFDGCTCVVIAAKNGEEDWKVVHVEARHTRHQLPADQLADKPKKKKKKLIESETDSGPARKKPKKSKRASQPQTDNDASVILPDLPFPSTSRSVSIDAPPTKPKRKKRAVLPSEAEASGAGESGASASQTSKRKKTSETDSAKASSSRQPSSSRRPASTNDATLSATPSSIKYKVVNGVTDIDPSSEDEPFIKKEPASPPKPAGPTTPSARPFDPPATAPVPLRRPAQAAASLPTLPPRPSPSAAAPPTWGSSDSSRRTQMSAAPIPTATLLERGPHWKALYEREMANGQWLALPAQEEKLSLVVASDGQLGTFVVDEVVPDAKEVYMHML